MRNCNVLTVLNTDKEKLAETECVSLMVEGAPEVMIFDVEEEVAVENRDIRRLVDIVEPDIHIDMSVVNDGAVGEIRWKYLEFAN